MKLDILDSFGKKIGEITDEYEGNALLVIMGIVAFVFMVVLPIMIWYIFLFRPNFHKGVNEQEMFNAICTTAAITPCVLSLISRLIFGSRFPLGQFFMSWFICSGITIAVAIIGINANGFLDTVLLPILACELPCFITMTIYGLFFRGKQS